LPEPFSSVTNTCSNDNDCRSIDANINVGKILRDITGLSIIHDASIPYPMHACASVTIPIIKASCGICVPCKQDADCTDIDITKVAGERVRSARQRGGGDPARQGLRSERPQVSTCIASRSSTDTRVRAVLEHPARLRRRASSGRGAPCDHDICTPGGPLGTQCETCTADVCAHDQYCCDKANGQWDALCKREVDEYCTTRPAPTPTPVSTKKRAGTAARSRPTRRTSATTINRSASARSA